ncbi:MAG: hypothetical protein QGE95_03320, partial [Arenicellales bacterium]|nr:hypothetical protein [Arenicellales bacterium]
MQGRSSASIRAESDSDKSAVSQSENYNSHPSITLPDASFLLYGTLEQVGFDLVITNPAGEVFIVYDYFSFNPPPNLMLANGAGLSPEMVEALLYNSIVDARFAGPAEDPGQAEEIGAVLFESGDVVAIRNGEEVELSKGDPLYKGDIIKTGDSSFIRAKMLDDTRFNLGKNGEATLSDFAYDANAGIGRFEASVRVGGFQYKSGGIGTLANNMTQAHSTIRTPSAIIGIRGSELEGNVDQSGQTTVVHRSGILDISDINLAGTVTLTSPDNTAVIALDGTPNFFAQPTAQQLQDLNANLPPPPTAAEEADAADDADQESEEDTQGPEGTEGEPQTEDATEGDETPDETTGEEGEGEEGEDDAEESDDESEDDTEEDGEEDSADDEQTDEADEADGTEEGPEDGAEGAEGEDAQEGDGTEGDGTEGETSEEGDAADGGESADDAAEDGPEDGPDDAPEDGTQ